MTRAQQRQFIRELVGNVKADLLAKSARVPAEWDGHELRQWIADAFQESSYTLQRDKARYRDYRNAVATIGGI